MLQTWNGVNRRNSEEDGERIAVLESMIESLMTGQKAIMLRLDELSSDITTYRGFVRGVVWVISGASVIAIAVWEFLRGHLILK